MKKLSFVTAFAAIAFAAPLLANAGDAPNTPQGNRLQEELKIKTENTAQAGNSGEALPMQQMDQARERNELRSGDGTRSEQAGEAAAAKKTEQVQNRGQTRSRTMNHMRGQSRFQRQQRISH